MAASHTSKILDPFGKGGITISDEADDWKKFMLNKEKIITKSTIFALEKLQNFF